MNMKGSVCVQKGGASSFASADAVKASTHAPAASGIAATGPKLVEAKAALEEDLATPYSYCLIRTDIPLEAQLVQACHSCLQHEAPADISHLILLAVPNEQALLKEEQRLVAEGLRPTLFFEPDNDMGYTSLAVGPVFGRKRRLLRRLPLWTQRLLTAA